MKHRLPLNDRIALFITKIIGTMWCAYAFAGLAFISLPAAIAGGTPTFISWLAQTLLQLVLLSVIMVGQNIQSRHTENLEEKIYTMERLHGEQLDTIIRLLDN